MTEISLYDYEKKYKVTLRALERSSVSERNKALIKEFLNDCTIGWGGKKLKLPTIIKYLSNLYAIAKILEKDFNYITKEDIKRILVAIDSDSRKKEWTRYAYRIALRKFVKWLREEHGYPSDYPNAEYLTKILPLIKYPEEVSKIKVGKVNKIKPREEIPTQDEMRFLREASLNSRDKAYFAVSEELGPRIGGIGTRKIKHVEFDDLGAKIYIHDKTMRGEPVQLVWSASYLREWRESHPFKHNPEAPLWINFTVPSKPVPLDYYGFRRMLQRTIKRHNLRAEANGLPKITRRIHTHAFRYFAQIRDELEGVPRSVQRKQRGWSVGSNMPDKYAAIVNSDVEEYFRKKYGLSGNENNNKPLTCPRCKEVNAIGNVYCRRCGLPLNEEAKKYDAIIDDLIEKIILDPELSQRLRGKILELKSGGAAE